MDEKKKEEYITRITNILELFDNEEDFKLILKWICSLFAKIF